MSVWRGLLEFLIGLRNNFVGVPYSFGSNTVLGHLNTAYYHVHGSSFVYPKYADPVTLTSAALSWDSTGNIIEVIPADTLTSVFDLHWISVSDISATLYGIIEIYAGLAGAEVMIGVTELFRTSNFVNEGRTRIQIPQQPANTRISCKFSDSTVDAQTCKVKIMGHYYG